MDNINHRVTYWAKILLTPFLSARWRGDLAWGFLCRCGNDNRLAKEEAKDFDKMVAGDPMSLKRIADSLKIPDEKQFRMDKV